MQAVDVAGMYVLVIRQTKYERISNTYMYHHFVAVSLPMPDTYVAAGLTMLAALH